MMFWRELESLTRVLTQRRGDGMDLDAVEMTKKCFQYLAAYIDLLIIRRLCPYWVPASPGELIRWRRTSQGPFSDSPSSTG